MVAYIDTVAKNSDAFSFGCRRFTEFTCCAPAISSRSLQSVHFMDTLTCSRKHDRRSYISRINRSYLYWCHTALGAEPMLNICVCLFFFRYNWHDLSCMHEFSALVKCLFCFFYWMFFFVGFGKALLCSILSSLLFYF